MSFVAGLVKAVGGVVKDQATEHVVDIVKAGRLWRPRFLKCSLVQRNSPIRVAFSGILRIADGDSYVLIRNLHRTEVFAPIGGVLKYTDGALFHLDRWDFQPDTPPPTEDSLRDLRGFVPRKHLTDLLKWFASGQSRETAIDCVRREVIEELEEIGLGEVLELPPTATFRTTRVVEEGPESVPGRPYTQYRVFEVVDLAVSEQRAEGWRNRLLDRANRDGNLLRASRHDIELGRTGNGRLLAHTSCYLLGSARTRPDLPGLGHESPDSRKKRQRKSKN